MKYITATIDMADEIRNGFGSYIMNCLEAEISKNHEVSVLDASLPAACLYEHRGYKTVGHGIYELGNGYTGL